MCIRSIVYINNRKSCKKICLALFFAVLSCNVFGQDWLSLFIGSASKYASVELSDYRKRLSMEYNVGSNELDDY